MEQQIIIPEHIVPQSIQDKKITNFVFYPDDKNISISIFDDSQTDNSLKFYTVNLDFNDIASKMTTQQKNIVKGFFKQLRAYALDVSTSDIIGDIVD